MGYYASGSGDATLKEGMGDALERAIRDHYKDAYCPIGYDIEPDYINIYDDEKYHADETKEFLDILTPFITEGILSYSGDDDCIWRFVFDYDNQKWNEEDATISYGFEDYSDEELIQELQSRGYKVTKEEE